MSRNVAAAVAVLAVLGACRGKKETAPSIQTATVQRQTIVVDAQATGVVEPINVVEVKSKASGLIVRMPVETGALVNPGDLLVQVDTRDVQNQYNQSAADVRAAEARLQVTQAQKRRSDEMFAARVITAQENEATSLDLENARAQLIRAQANLDLAKQRLEDATVTAPVAGTIIEKSVSLGQVITSATGAFGGGTTLLKMADLNRVRIRALFNETDIGQVRPGQVATVVVDAYPDRRFQGMVEKIEPSAVVQQNVTMFPVLVTLDNRDGLLKPGMNGEASVLVDRLENVLAVPNDAVKNVREAVSTAPMLGLNADTVQAQIRAQFAAAGGGMGGGRRGGPGGQGGQQGGQRVTTSPGDVALDANDQGPQMPEVTDQQCAEVRQALARKPAEARKLDELMARMREEGADRRAIMQEARPIYESLGIDPRVAGACRRRQGGGQQGAQAQQGTQRGGSPAAGAQAQQSQRGGRAGNGNGNGQRAGGFSSPEAGGIGRRVRPGLVFVAEGKTYKPRVVMLGASNFDYTEVVSGLREGEEVVLLTALALQAQRQQQAERFRGMQGIPGMQNQQQQGGAGGQGGQGGAGARGGQGGANRGGGGR